MIISIRQHYTLTFASGTTGIQNISQIVFIGLTTQFFNLRLFCKILTQLNKVFEHHRIRIMAADTYIIVVNDDPFEGWTKGKYTVSLIILLLLAYEQITDMGIIDNILHLSLTACSIKRYCYCPNSECAEITK